MADGSIIFSTKMDTTKFDEDIEATKAKIKELQKLETQYINKSEKAFASANKYSVGTSKWNEYSKQGNEFIGQSVDISSQIVEQKTKLEDLNTEKAKAIGESKSYSTKLNEADKATSKLSKGIFKLTTIFKLLVVRMIMRGVINNLVEGFNNLVQYSDALNNSASKVYSSLLYLKNSIAAAVAPLVNLLAPSVSNIIDLFAQANNYIAQFFSALAGNKTFVKAVKTQEDYAKSLKDTKNQLASIDQLNIATSSNLTASGTSVSDMFDTVDVDPALAANLANVKVVLDALWQAFLLLIEPLGYIWTTFVVPFLTWMGAGIAEFIGWIAEKLGEFVQWCKDDPNAVAIISAAMKELFFGVIIAASIAGIVKILGSITTASKALKLAWVTLQSPVFWLVIGIGLLIAGITALSANWDKLTPLERTITVLGALAVAAIAAAAAVAIFHTAWTIGLGAAAIAGGLALLGLTFAFSKNDSSGEDFLNSFSAIDFSSGYSLPQLASGAVLPANQPFAAIVGDQKHGTNVEAPLDTIVQAVRVALGGGMKVSLVCEGSLSTVVKAVVSEVNAEFDRTGESPINT